MAESQIGVGMKISRYHFEPWDLSIEHRGEKISEQREQILHWAKTCKMKTFPDVPEQSVPGASPPKPYLSQSRFTSCGFNTPEFTSWFKKSSLPKAKAEVVLWLVIYPRFHWNEPVTYWTSQHRNCLVFELLDDNRYNQHQLRDNPYQSGKGLGYGS